MYDRQISSEQTLTFGVSGMLYQNGLIMYDHQTESLWSHILGQAIAGQYQGTQLTFVPTLHTTWQNWKALHPDTLVISPGLYGSDPYESYYVGGSQGVVGRGRPDLDGDLHPKEYVIGVRLGGQARAYPFTTLQRDPVVNDQIGDIPVAVFFDQSSLTGAVFDARLEDGTTLTFEPTDFDRIVIDTDTKSEWNILTGQAVNGELEGTQLKPVPVTYSFWFGWIDYHNESTVYQ